MSKKKQELTPWFPPEVKPARVGAYEFKGCPTPFHWFDGLRWTGLGDSPKQAMSAHKDGYVVSLPYTKETPWRGLAKKP